MGMLNSFNNCFFVGEKNLETKFFLPTLLI